MASRPKRSAGSIWPPNDARPARLLRGLWPRPSRPQSDDVAYSRPATACDHRPVWQPPWMRPKASFRTGDTPPSRDPARTRRGLGAGQRVRMRSRRLGPERQRAARPRAGLDPRARGGIARTAADPSDGSGRCGMVATDAAFLHNISYRTHEVSISASPSRKKAAGHAGGQLGRGGHPP